MKETCDLGISYLDEEYRDYENQFLKESEAELTLILNLKDPKGIAGKVTFDQLIKMTFNKAHEVIQRMDLKKRITILEQLRVHIEHLYEAVKGYNDKGFGKSLSPQVFYSLMGKIKHFEIIQNWLYGID
jgi:hypothetical protein